MPLDPGNRELEPQALHKARKHRRCVLRVDGFRHGIFGLGTVKDRRKTRHVRRLTDGRGVDTAYDGIGGDMLLKTLACVRPFGTVASIGQAAGPIAPLNIEEVGPRRSLSLARPSFMAYSADMKLYRVAAEAVVAAMRLGIASTIGATYALQDAAQAHADLEAGRSMGSLLLVP